MSSQISHIIYAQQYFKKYPSLIDKDEFMMGCVFPDIRRIDDTIKRRETHLCFKNLDLNFDGLSGFEAGWKFHLYCDMRREEILNRYDFYSIRYSTDFWHHASKLLEDQIIYDKYNNWEKVALYFNNAPDIRTGLAVPYETLALWYAIVAKYISEKPNDKSISIFLSKQLKLCGIANEIVDSVNKLEKNKKAVEILKKVNEEIV